MKKIFTISALLVAAVIGTSSCSKSYLDVAPQNYIETSSVFSDIQGAEAAVNGLSRLMTLEYTFGDGFSGEGAILNYYGNYPGNDFQKCNRTGMSSIINASSHMLLDSSYDYYPWTYYYRIILNANMILKNIDSIKGENIEAKKDYYRAQALTFRAFSYFRLSELYCNRWTDTHGEWEYKEGNEVKVYRGWGASQGVPLRLEPTTGDLACCGLWQLKDQIYKDLTDAINYFKLSGMDRLAKEYYKPNVNVAYAVLARAALTYNDWATAAKYAPLAREGFPLMSATEYLEGGFNTANEEWIWGSYDAVDQNLSGRSFFNYMASNSTSSNCRTYPCAISKQLYELIPQTDIRRRIWLEPTAEDCLPENGFNVTTGRSTGTLAERAKVEYKDKLCWDNRTGELLSNIYMYMQFKFQTSHLPGVGCVPFIRAEELYLVEAEALYHLGGYETRIWALLKELNQRFDPDFDTDKSGQELMDQIFLYRRLGLWGEGFDWYDYKRMGLEINRVDIASGGSFHDTFKITIKPSGRNKWTWVIPRKESDYNKLVVTVGESQEELIED